MRNRQTIRNRGRNREREQYRETTGDIRREREKAGKMRDRLKESERKKPK